MSNRFKEEVLNEFAAQYKYGMPIMATIQNMESELERTIWDYVSSKVAHK